MPKRDSWFKRWFSRRFEEKLSPGWDWSGMTAVVLASMLLLAAMVGTLFLLTEAGPAFLRGLRTGP